MKKMDKIYKLLLKKGYSSINLEEKEDIIFLSGELSSWDEIVDIGLMVSKTKLYYNYLSFYIQSQYDVS